MLEEGAEEDRGRDDHQPRDREGGVLARADDVRPPPHTPEDGGHDGVRGEEEREANREAADLGPLASDPRWVPLAGQPGMAVWTDDFSSILSVLRWR